MLHNQNMVDNLFNQGWYLQENIFTKEYVQSINQLMKNQIFNNATIGHEKILNKDIRNDSISWLQKDSHSPLIQEYFSFTNNIAKVLNQEFYIGVNDFECHFAQYEAGGFYKPHYDNLHGKNNRAVTVITYLNQNWEEKDGGCLEIILPEKKISIAPLAGSVIVFLSDLILHEVTTSYKKRQSITGWFIKNNSIF